MIFHTAADPIYFKAFYNAYANSIKQYFNSPLFSLNFVGLDQPHLAVDYLFHDKISFEEIKIKFNADDRAAHGYYCMSRWNSIPVVNEHVCVSDIDVIAINPIDNLLISNLLEKHKVVNLTRLKPKTGAEGGMMIIFLHKDICQEVKEFSKQLLESNPLCWGTDINVRNYLYNNFDVKNLIKMKEISKPNNQIIDDPWFIYSKVNKFSNLTRVYNSVLT
jgi:hypothetical protein